MKVAFFTLGCKVNQYETNAMIQKFIEAGHKEVNVNDEADVYIINTCTVTNMSDKKSRQLIRKAKEQNRNAIIVAVGCYAQVAKEKILEIPEVDLILGNNEKNDIVDYIENYLNTSNKSNNVTDVMHKMEFSEFGSVTYTEKTRAVIKIQDGCDKFCSYCIIPYARGRVRSRKAENIISEIIEIAKEGIKEVVLTGIHIASYGKDFKSEYGLIELIEDINKIEDIKRIRIGSLEPTFITEERAEKLSKIEKLCNHFHLSLQSANNKTLQRMNRKYTIEDFEKVVEIIRKNFREVILTTDIIVGFPGETEEEFANTYENLKRINFYKMHIFKFSPRTGTKAAVMEEQISGVIKDERSKKLLKLSDECQKKYLEKYLGKKVEVLFEDIENGYMKGHTKNYIVVNTESNVESNIIKIVEINEIRELELFGKIV